MLPLLEVILGREVFLVGCTQGVDPGGSHFFQICVTKFSHGVELLV